MIHPLLLAGLTALLTSSCAASASKGDGGAAPIIDSLSLPAFASIGSDGQYDLTGTISFHSTTGTVGAIHVTSSDLHTDSQIAGPGVAKAVEATLIVHFPPDNPLGTAATYFVSVIDQAGLESAPNRQMVTLQ